MFEKYFLVLVSKDLEKIKNLRKNGCP